MSEEKFEEWAILEIFGHTRIAGKVSEATIGGSSLIRVDVPDNVNGGFRFTKYYGQGAIYAMTPVEEKIARVAADNIDADPVNIYSLKRALEEYDKRYSERPAQLPHEDAGIDPDDELEP